MTHYIHQTSKTNNEGKEDLFRETAREESSSSTSKKMKKTRHKCP